MKETLDSARGEGLKYIKVSKELISKWLPTVATTGYIEEPSK